MEQKINKTKRQLTERKIFANLKSDQESVSKIYEELIKPNTKNMNNPVKNGQKIHINIFLKKTSR